MTKHYQQSRIFWWPSSVIWSRFPEGSKLRWCLWLMVPHARISYIWQLIQVLEVGPPDSTTSSWLNSCLPPPLLERGCELLASASLANHQQHGMILQHALLAFWIFSFLQYSSPGMSTVKIETKLWLRLQSILGKRIVKAQSVFQHFSSLAVSMHASLHLQFRHVNPYLIMGCTSTLFLMYLNGYFLCFFRPSLCHLCVCVALARLGHVNFIDFRSRI